MASLSGGGLCELSGKGQQHLDPQTVFSHYLKIWSGCLNTISDFWKTELCSLCFTSNQKDITLVFLFPVVGEKRATCCLDSSLWAVCAAPTGTSAPCAAECLLSLRHLAASAWQGNSLCSSPERIRSQTEIRISISGNWQQESWKPSDRVGPSSVQSLSPHKWGLLFTRFIPSFPVQAVVLGHENNVKDDGEDTQAKLGWISKD